MIARVWRSHGIRVKLTEATMKLFFKSQWPGNVRELSNLVERLAVMRPDGEIHPEDLPAPLRSAEGSAAVRNSKPTATDTQKLGFLPEGGLDLKQHLAGVEKQMIASAMQQSNGVVQKAAEILGVGRTTLAEKIRRHGLRT